MISPACEKGEELSAEQDNWVIVQQAAPEKHYGLNQLRNLKQKLVLKFYIRI